MTSAYIKSKAFVSIILAGALVALAGCSGDPQQIAVEGSSKAAKQTQCVADTDFMRRNHMELIKHQRIETVRQGVRKTDYSLAGCIDCHVQFDDTGAPVSVYSDGQFCSRCHEYTGTSLTCFQCHADVPSSGEIAEAARSPTTDAHRMAMFADEQITSVAGVAGVKAADYE